MKFLEITKVIENWRNSHKGDRIAEKRHKGDPKYLKPQRWSKRKKKHRKGDPDANSQR